MRTGRLSQAFGSAKIIEMEEHSIDCGVCCVQAAVSRRSEMRIERRIERRFRPFAFFI
jgi:hypothetical protein